MATHVLLNAVEQLPAVIDRLSKLEALSNELATRLLTLEYKASTKTEASVPQITAERLSGFLDDVMDHVKRSFPEGK